MVSRTNRHYFRSFVSNSFSASLFSEFVGSTVSNLHLPYLPSPVPFQIQLILMFPSRVFIVSVAYNHIHLFILHSLFIAWLPPFIIRVRGQHKHIKVADLTCESLSYCRCVSISNMTGVYAKVWEAGVYQTQEEMIYSIRRERRS